MRYPYIVHHATQIPPPCPHCVRHHANVDFCHILYYFLIKRFKHLHWYDIIYLGDEKWLPDINLVTKKLKRLSRLAGEIKTSEQRQG